MLIGVDGTHINRRVTCDSALVLLRLHREQLERWTLDQAGALLGASKEPGKLCAV